MQSGEMAGFFQLTDEDKTIAVEALITDGYDECAEAITKFLDMKKEVHPFTLSFIMESVRKFARPERPDIQKLVDSYDELVPSS